MVLLSISGSWPTQQSALLLQLIHQLLSPHLPAVSVCVVAVTLYNAVVVMPPSLMIEISLVDDRT